MLACSFGSIEKAVLLATVKTQKRCLLFVQDRSDDRNWLSFPGQDLLTKDGGGNENSLVQSPWGLIPLDTSLDPSAIDATKMVEIQGRLTCSYARWQWLELKNKWEEIIFSHESGSWKADDLWSGKKSLFAFLWMDVTLVFTQDSAFVVQDADWVTLHRLLPRPTPHIRFGWNEHLEKLANCVPSAKTHKFVRIGRKGFRTEPQPRWLEAKKGKLVIWSLDWSAADAGQEVNNWKKKTIAGVNMISMR